MRQKKRYIYIHIYAASAKFQVTSVNSLGFLILTADMFPPGTDFIIAYMDSLPVFDGSEREQY